jgi:hypothetical protein
LFIQYKRSSRAMIASQTGRDILTGAHVLVPVATPVDARKTATALTPHSPSRVTVAHVVERREHIPDKRPLEQSEVLAREALEAFRETFPGADGHVEYNRDVTEGILDAADACDPDAIAFRPRGGNRFVQYLTGDNALRLVTEADRPVVSFPHAGATE